MIVDASLRALALLLAVGVARASGSNLRRRRATLLGGHHGRDVGGAPPAAAARSLRGPPAPAAPAHPPAEEAAGGPAEEDEAAASAAPSAPSLALDRSAYAEGDSITATFSVGPPSHPYYSSGDAPSLASELDFDYPHWSVGLFMRDADPQGGSLEPIVRVDACEALGDACDAGNFDYARYSELRVTFGNEHLEVMQGRWPLEISEYGTGFDAYVLDGKGAAAIGPLEFGLRGEDEEGEAEGAAYAPASLRAHDVAIAAAHVPDVATVEISGRSGRNPLLKYKKGTKRATGRKRARAAGAPSAPQADVKVAEAKGPEASSDAVPSDGSVPEVAGPAETAGPSKGTVASDKPEYEEDESVSIQFSLESSKDVAGYRIGIFMRMAHPQGGTLEPITSLPLCPEGGCIKESGLVTGSVRFSHETMMDMTPAPKWPIDLYQWGTGFDAYVLDEDGDDVVGPVKFNIMMGDTY